METIKVKEICGEYCIDENDVLELSKRIIEQLNTNLKVTLDFNGVDTVLTAFFNGLLSELFSKFDQTKIQNLIEFTDSTSDSIKKKYARSFENAKKFYSAPREVQNQIKDRINKIFNKEISLNEPLGASC